MTGIKPVMTTTKRFGINPGTARCAVATVFFVDCLAEVLTLPGALGVVVASLAWIAASARTVSVQAV